MPNYRIQVAGHLDAARWADYFAGLTLTSRPDGTTILEGPLPDQGALFGVLLGIRDLNLALLAVQQLSAVQGARGDAGRPGPGKSDFGAGETGASRRGGA